MDVALYLLLVFGTQGHGFESTSLFWGDVGLSIQLWLLGVVGLNPHFLLGGYGFEFFFCWGLGIFLKFCLVWVVLVLL